jgi:hypothetical protein
MDRMGLGYLATDVAEDLKLASILDRAAKGGDDAVAAVDAGEAAANMLTRVKLVSITPSAGIAVFLVLATLAAIVIRHRAIPPRARAGTWGH